MIHVFIDLEFCTCFRKSSPLRTETIEIGAVKLDSELNFAGEFDRLVRPDFAKSIPSTERNLTGITWNMVENEKSFFDVIDDFFRWVGPEEEYLIYSWSANDAVQCLRESRVKGYPLTEMGVFDRWIDLQKVFMTAVGVKNQISLERAIEMADLYFSGVAHRADVDAYNTARLYRYCMSVNTVDLKPVTLGSLSGDYQRDSDLALGVRRKPSSSQGRASGRAAGNGTEKHASRGRNDNNRANRPGVRNVAASFSDGPLSAPAAGAGEAQKAAKKKHRGGRKHKKPATVQPVENVQLSGNVQPEKQPEKQPDKQPEEQPEKQPEKRIITVTPAEPVQEPLKEEPAQKEKPATHKKTRSASPRKKVVKNEPESTPAGTAQEIEPERGVSVPEGHPDEAVIKVKKPRKRTSSAKKTSAPEKTDENPGNT